jgi:hypothetical protein
MAWTLKPLGLDGARPTTPMRRVDMAQTEPPAVIIARAHAEAWSNHDWEQARKMLAPNVHVTSMSTQPSLPATDVAGVDEYMEGLIKFAQAVEPDSAHVIASVGDDRNALLLLTVEANLDGKKVTLPASRLYLLDEDNKIQTEQVVFFALSA